MVFRFWSLVSLSLVFGAFVLLHEAEGGEVVCYHGTWAYWRQGDGKFTTDDIDPFLCTQLVFAFFDIGSDGTVKVLEPAFMEPPIDTIGKYYGLKQRNPALRTIAAVGGWNAGTQNFARVAANPSLRTTFARNAVQFLQRFRLDGMDIDWEYPTAADRNNFVLFLEELRNAFAPFGYLLTVAVAATEGSGTAGYEIPAIASRVNFIHLMEYDMHTKVPGVTGHNAPIFASPSDSGAQTQQNVQASIQYWLRQGAPASKLTLGVPLYGRTFTLADSSRTGVGAPVRGAGQPGIFTQEAGMLGYNEICRNQWPAQFDSLQVAMYASRGDQWVSYDDVNVVRRKCALIAQYGLAGGMVWSIETDDFRGACGPKYPLISTLRGCVDNPEPVTTVRPTTRPVTTVRTTARAITTTARPATSGGQIVCTRDGYFRHPTDCSRFYRCVSGTAYHFACSPELRFNEAISACDWPANVQC